jgi:hypothetical protein
MWLSSIIKYHPAIVSLVLVIKFDYYKHLANFFNNPTSDSAYLVHPFSDPKSGSKQLLNH